MMCVCTYIWTHIDIFMNINIYTKNKVKSQYFHHVFMSNEWLLSQPHVFLKHKTLS